MNEIPRSPSEYYIRYLITGQDPDAVNANEIARTLEAHGLDGLSSSYIRSLAKAMLPLPSPFVPDNPRHKPSRTFLKRHKIYDMWHPTRASREAMLILSDIYLREKLDPLLLSALTHVMIARKLRKFTSIALTPEGVTAYGHYFFNRKLLTQQQWMVYLRERTYTNPHVQSLVTTPDIAKKHLPWVIGVAGPSGAFDAANAASRIGQIAFKHALELEHRPATLDNTMALKNCMTTIEKADVLMRRSDVALKDVLKQFQKFHMKLDSATVPDVQQLTGGNFSRSGEGTDIEEDE